MNSKFLSMLCCPLCHGSLTSIAFPRNGGASDGSRAPASGEDAGDGILVCRCGMTFPVIEGVPRLIEKGLLAFPQFVRTYRDKLTVSHALADMSSDPGGGEPMDEYDKIRAAYSMTWNLFDYTGDKTWGWTIEDRKRVFLDDIGLRAEDLRGKCLLDAGCGNGTLTAAISSLGAEVVGIDLNDGLGSANRSKAHYAGGFQENVYYVQGNLFRPPLNAEMFDLIYCSGAVHRTPDPQGTFKKLVPLLKKNGRLHVWVSRRRGSVVGSLKRCAYKLTRPMSLDGRLKACRAVAPFYKAGTGAANALGIAKFRKRTVREITLDLCDSLAPEYASAHTEDEVQGWFREQGFRNITVAGRQKHGFGVNGDKT